MPRLSIARKVIRRIDLHHQSPGKNKDYRVTVSEDVNNVSKWSGPGSVMETNTVFHVYAEWGPAGRLSQGMEKAVYALKANAFRFADQLVQEKTMKGDRYKVVSDHSFEDVPDTPEATASPPCRRKRLLSTESLSLASRAILNHIF